MPLAVEQPLTRGFQNPPKNDTPHPKTKKKPQQDSRRSTVRIKSNPITTRWVIHRQENNNTEKVLPLL